MEQIYNENSTFHFSSILVTTLIIYFKVVHIYNFVLIDAKSSHVTTVIDNKQ